MINGGIKAAFIFILYTFFKTHILAIFTKGVGNFGADQLLAKCMLNCSYSKLVQAYNGCFRRLVFSKQYSPSPEMVKGWWWIREPEELAAVFTALHPRGIREKVLRKNLTKHMEFLTEFCTQPMTGKSSFKKKKKKNTQLCRYLLFERNILAAFLKVSYNEQLGHPVFFVYKTLCSCYKVVVVFEPLSYEIAWENPSSLFPSF